MIPLHEFEFNSIVVARDYAVEETSYRARRASPSEQWSCYLSHFEECLINQLDERATEVCS